METHRFCDVSLPVPLDQPFTYALPETLRHRVRPGCRLVVPFGSRKLTGVVLACHDDPPAAAARDAMRLLDAEPVLGAELLALGRWIAGYYCAPLGEVLRGMLPLASEIRRGKIYSLTASGRDAARQLVLDASPDDPAVQILRLLERRPIAASYFARKLPLADKALRALERKGFVAVEQVQTERDPLRVSRRKTARRSLPDAAPPARLAQSRARTAGLPAPAPRFPQPEGGRGPGAERQPGGAGSGAPPAGEARCRAPLERAGGPHARAPHPQSSPAGRVCAHSRCRYRPPLRNVPASRRHRLRQDRGLPERHRNRARRRPRRAAAGARNRPHPRHGRAVLLALRRPRGHPAQRLHRYRAQRPMAAHPLRRRRRGGGYALGRVRPGARTGPHRSG